MTGTAAALAALALVLAGGIPPALGARAPVPCRVELEPAGRVAFNLDGDRPALAGHVGVGDADADPRNGVQAALSATTRGCEGGEAVLKVDGAPAATVAVTGPRVEFGHVTLPAGAPVVARVEVRPVGSGGPRGVSANRFYVVDPERPAPVVIAPAPGSALGGADDLDGDPANSFRLGLVVEAPGLERRHASPSGEGARIEVEAVHRVTGRTFHAACEAGGAVCASDGDRYRVPVDLGADGSYEVEVTVTDPAGNVARTVPVAFLVEARPAAVAIVSPAPDAVVNASSPEVRDGALAVRVSARGRRPGAPVTVACRGADAPAAGTLDARGEAVLQVPFAAAPCGGVNTTCTAFVDGGRAPLTGPPASFRVDLAPPAPVIVAPGEGARVGREAEIEVAAACLEDGQDVQVRADRGAAASARARGEAAVATLSLAAGRHVITASTEDQAGNRAEAGPVTVEVDPARPRRAAAPARPPVRVDRRAPQLAIAAPADAALLGAAADVDPRRPGVQADVALTWEGLEDGQAVHLFLTRASAPGVEVEAEESPRVVAPGTRTGDVFPAVTLAGAGEDAVTLIARAADAAGHRARAVATLRVDASPPKAAIVRPGGAACAAPDPRLAGPSRPRYEVAVSGVPDGTRVRLCGASPGDAGPACALAGYTEVAEAPAHGGRAVLPAPPPGTATARLVAEVEDPAGNFALSEPVPVCGSEGPAALTWRRR